MLNITRAGIPARLYDSPLRPLSLATAYRPLRVRRSRYVPLFLEGRGSALLTSLFTLLVPNRPVTISEGKRLDVKKRL